MDLKVVDRFKGFKEKHCWQYEIRKQNLEDDLKESNLLISDVENLKISDFTFDYISKDDKIGCQEIKEFIERHEWLSKLPTRPTHRFVAKYKDKIAGAIVMATPNSFAFLLGKENKHLEKLISRGACISWSPKNLASALIMYSIKWMVKNTHYRIFTAYSDPEAKELGTIYQACNFYYLGQKSGGNNLFFDNNRPHLGWFSDRNFRQRSYYKFYAKNLNIEWNKEWTKGCSINWNIMPNGIEEKLRQAGRDYQKSCESRKAPKKHKYCYVLGATKIETKILRKLFFKTNPELINLSYPKERGKF